MSKFKLSNRSIERLDGLDPELMEVPLLAITFTVIDFGIPRDGGVRTAKRQGELYADGKSKADGFTNLSNHQIANDGYGKAEDFYAFVNGSPSWEPHHLAMVACAHLQAASMLGVKIKWGGLWQRKVPKFINGIPYGWDMAHIEKIN